MPTKLSQQQRTAIAKAKLAGASPSELARQYGLTPGYVCNLTQAYERDQKLRAFHNLTQQVRKRTIVDPPPIEMPEPAGTHFEPRPDEGKTIFVRKHISYLGQNTGAEYHDLPITLPFVSIQGRRD